MGMGLVFVVLAGRIAWIHSPWGLARKFARKKTDFYLLGKPYQPKWGPASEVNYTGRAYRGSPAFFYLDGETVRRENNSTQTLIEDSVQGSFGHNLMRFEVSADFRAGTEPPIPLFSLYSEESCHGRCGVITRPEFEDKKGILTVHLVETFKGVSRKATFRFRLTPEGFVAVED